MVYHHWAIKNNIRASSVCKSFLIYIQPLPYLHYSIHQLPSFGLMFGTSEMTPVNVRVLLFVYLQPAYKQVLQHMPPAGGPSGDLYPSTTNTSVTNQPSLAVVLGSRAPVGIDPSPTGENNHNSVVALYKQAKPALKVVESHCPVAKCTKSKGCAANEP